MKILPKIKPMTEEEYKKYVDDTHNNAYEQGKKLLQAYQFMNAKPTKHKH
jgi:hypothetical protein